MKNNLLLLLCFFSITTAQSQNFSISAGGENHHLPSFNYTTDFEWTIYDYDIDNQSDTFYFSQRTSYRFHNETEFWNFVGFQAQLNASWKIKNNFEFETGLGTRYSGFTASEVGGETEVLERFEREIIDSLPVFVPVLGYSCDEFHSEGNLDFIRPTFTTFEINIPFKLYFKTWDDDIKFGIGASIASNIFAVRTQSVSTRSDELIDGQYHCTSTYEVRNIPENEIFRKFNFGANASFEYWFFRKLGLMLSIENRFQDIFLQNEFNQVQFFPRLIPRKSTRPIYLGASVKYGINR